MITLEGLTSQQHALATLLWACDSQDQLNSFLATLKGSMRQDAETVMQLIIIESTNQVIEESPELLDQAQHLLAHYRL